MNTSSRALLLSLVAAVVGCAALDDVDDTGFVDDDGLVIDADVVVAGVAVTFVADGDVVDCVAEGRCSARFGDVVAEIANTPVVPEAVLAVVPAGVTSGPACFTVDDVERCVAVDVAAAPAVVAVTARTEVCACRCVAPTYTVLEVTGTAFPVDAVVTVDDSDEYVGVYVEDSTRLQASFSDVVSSGRHTITVRAPLHGDAESAPLTFGINESPTFP